MCEPSFEEQQFLYSYGQIEHELDSLMTTITILHQRISVSTYENEREAVKQVIDYMKLLVLMRINEQKKLWQDFHGTT